MNGPHGGVAMLRWIIAFALAVPPLAVALLTHQAVQRAWLPAIPWWDKLVIGGVLCGVACLWCVRYARKRLPDLAPIPIACIMMGTILISLDVVSFRVRPDIAAAWAATWGRIPWWDKLLALAGALGAYVYHRCKHHPRELRAALAFAAFTLAFSATWLFEPPGLVHKATGVWDAACSFLVVAAAFWMVVENVRLGHSAAPTVPAAFVAPAPESRARVVWRHGKARVAVGRAEGPAYDAIGQLTWSRDGRHVAYAAKRQDHW
jgi:hypothetical protein